MMRSPVLTPLIPSRRIGTIVFLRRENSHRNETPPDGQVVITHFRKQTCTVQNEHVEKGDREFGVSVSIQAYHQFDDLKKKYEVEQALKATAEDYAKKVSGR